MNTTTDKTLLILTALFVGGLALVAGAISFDHMRELVATLHGQTGWKSLAFPISVDGLEIVASLYLVAQRRAGRATGWVPWLTLVVGTAASLAANVAVGGADPIGKALAGWPALSMLVSGKLLFPCSSMGGVMISGRSSGTINGRPGRSRTAWGPSSIGTGRQGTVRDRPGRPAHRPWHGRADRTHPGRFRAPERPGGTGGRAHRGAPDPGRAGRSGHPGRARLVAVAGSPRGRHA